MTPEEKRRLLFDKFIRLPVPAVDTADLAALDKSAGIMRSLIHWAEAKGVLGRHRNDDTGWDGIAITRTSVRDVVRHHAGDAKIAVLAIAPVLIKGGCIWKQLSATLAGM